MRGFVLWLLAFAVSAVIGTHGIAYWDAGDYTLLAITGGQSGLLLGRPLFLWISRGVLATGVDPANAETVLRWFWSAVGATASPAMALLASRLGLDNRSALLAGTALALSPSFAHTSHQVLTDAPALALSIAALACAAGNQPWRAGVLLAAAIATRETAVVHLIAIVLLLGARRGLIASIACAVSLGVVIAAAPPSGLHQWLGAMSQSAGAYRWSLLDLGMAIVWVLAAGPVPVCAGAVALVRGETSARVRLVAIPAAIATIFFLFYPDGSFSPRYVLASAPVAFFLAAAPWLARGVLIAAAALAIPLVAAALPAARANAVAAQGATLTDRIPLMPANAVVVPGHFCPQARLSAAIAKRSDLTFVCPGWDWPADLAAELDSAVRQGRAVAADPGDSAWVGRREDQPKAEVRAWLGLRETNSVAGFAVARR